jgi:hypothetical protein
MDIGHMFDRIHNELEGKHNGENIEAFAHHVQHKHSHENLRGIGCGNRPEFLDKRATLSISL